MATTRKHYSPKFKAKVAPWTAIRGELTLSQLASQYLRASGADWPVAQDGAAATGGARGGWGQEAGSGRTHDAEKDALIRANWMRLKVELDWLKKKLVCSTE